MSYTSFKSESSASPPNLRSLSYAWPDTELVAGIINVTPDSFYDGGSFVHEPSATKHGLKLLDSGADLLDIGGCSTRPGARLVEEKIEIERILPVIRSILSLRPDALISIDTFRSGVALAALESGASIINDVSGLKFDPGLVEVLKDYQPGYILTHAFGNPDQMGKRSTQKNILEMLDLFFAERLNFLVNKGLAEQKIALDPGIGLGKTAEDDLKILRNIRHFNKFGRPIMIGISNKSFLGTLFGLSQEGKEKATLLVSALLSAAFSERTGANPELKNFAPESVSGIRLVHRVHDVAGAKMSLLLTKALL